LESIVDADRIELFDSIDSMDMEELSCLYALVHLGLETRDLKYNELVQEANSRGFVVVDELLELKSLGSSLRRGVFWYNEKGD